MKSRFNKLTNRKSSVNSMNWLLPSIVTGLFTILVTLSGAGINYWLVDKATQEMNHARLEIDKAKLEVEKAILINQQASLSISEASNTLQKQMADNDSQKVVLNRESIEIARKQQILLEQGETKKLNLDNYKNSREDALSSQNLTGLLGDLKPKAKVECTGDWSTLVIAIKCQVTNIGANTFSYDKPTVILTLVDGTPLTSESFSIQSPYANYIPSQMIGSAMIEITLNKSLDKLQEMIVKTTFPLSTDDAIVDVATKRAGNLVDVKLMKAAAKLNYTYHYRMIKDK